MTPPTDHQDTLFALALSFLMAALGPLLGQLVLIIACSFIGALIALSHANTPRLWPDGAIVLGRGMGLAVLIGGAGSVLWAKLLGDGWGYPEGLAVVSALVGLRTDWALARLGVITGVNAQ